MHGSSWTGIGRAVKIVLLDEAQERFQAEDRWWREHRDARELFVTEFQEVGKKMTAEWVAKAIPSVFCTVAQPVLVVPAELESSEDAGVGAVAKTMRGARPADPRFSGAPPPSIAENSTVACATDTVASR